MMDARICCCFFSFLCITPYFIILVVFLTPTKDPVPKVELASIDFTVLSITHNRLSAKWDLSIRIPEDLPGEYICLQGDFQASCLYKNVSLVTSSPQKYCDLKYGLPQLLKVSAVVSGEDMGGSIGKYIMEDVKEKKQVQFGLLISLTDCRKKTSGVMSYKCHEATLMFEPGSEMKASVFGKHPSCINF